MAFEERRLMHLVSELARAEQVHIFVVTGMPLAIKYVPVYERQ